MLLPDCLFVAYWSGKEGRPRYIICREVCREPPPLAPDLLSIALTAPRGLDTCRTVDIRLAVDALLPGAGLVLAYSDSSS